jgi:hypothetical protein
VQNLWIQIYDKDFLFGNTSVVAVIYSIHCEHINVDEKCVYEHNNRQKKD